MLHNKLLILQTLASIQSNSPDLSHPASPQQFAFASLNICDYSKACMSNKQMRAYTMHMQYTH